MKSQQQYKARVKIVVYATIDSTYYDADNSFIDRDAKILAEEIMKTARLEDSTAVVSVDDIEVLPVV